MKSTFPTHSEFLFPFLDILNSNSPIYWKDLSVEIAKYFGLTKKDLSLTTRKGSSTLFDSRIQWCRQHCRWAEFIDYPKRGVWAITKEGKDFLAKHSRGGIEIKDLMDIPSFAAHKTPKKKK